MPRRLAIYLVSVGTFAALATSPARSQCTGDCSGDNMVAINELIIGVTIALGSRPAADCPAFQNASGMVDIAQLIRAVNFALNGCPAASSPTATVNVTVTSTPTTTASSMPTATAVPTSGPIGTHACILVPGNSASHVEVNRANFPVPSIFPLTGTIDVTCGGGGSDGRALCSCRPRDFVPVSVTGVGKICVTPSDTACPSRPIACTGGGTGLGASLAGDGDIGSCAGNAECATLCDTTCAAFGSARVQSGCTGFCSAGTMQVCNRDDQCAPDNGVCNGRDAVGANARKCQCQCLNAMSGTAPRPGELQCALQGVIAVVPETADCTAPARFTAPSCTVLTTGESASVLTDTNYQAGSSIPSTGMLSNVGTPLSCEMLRDGHLTGLKLRGAFGAFGGTPSGDALNEVFLECQ